MPVSIDIQSNYHKLNRSLDQLGRKQLPFAFSRTLNDTMFKVREHAVKTVYPRSFDVRDPKFFSAIMRVEKSTKTRLVASLSDKVGREYLERHSKGGIKRARGGRIAIPSRELAARRSGRGVPKGMRPSALVSSPRGFVGHTKSGQQVIYQRKGKRRYPIRVQYVLEPSASIRKTFPFYEEAQRLTRRESGRIFKRHFRKAVETARRR
tara:strand:- start:167 stop:790 length:624 start_codon:yes stop_codon:yes gene_type:complete